MRPAATLQITKSAEAIKSVNNEIHVLLVSASSADEAVLAALLARDEAAAGVSLSAADDAQSFYEALHSERSYQVIVIDERQSWSDWRAVAAACVRNRPNALLALLSAPERAGDQEELLSQGIAVAYPRTSAGLIALTRLVGRLGIQERAFSLRYEEQVAATTEEPGEEDRERLVYAVSHDLQDPLQLARRYADILNEDFNHELGDTGSKVLGHLQFNLTRTQEMLDELLEYSRLQSAQPDRQPVDFNELLDEVAELYRLTLDEIGGSVTRQQRLPTLMVDRRQFLRVMQNLIGNAIKFRSERPLQISVRSQRVRNEWRIGIKDNGIGMSEDDAMRVFGMFERGAGAESHPGTGMGLAICKRIVQNHGGKIWVRSSPGSGSVFIFSVPQPEDSTDPLEH
jgi:signal transduction histidine kinase